MIDKEIGKLKHRIKIGRLKKTEDVNGGLKHDFNSFKEVWAEIKPLPLTNSLPFRLSNESNPRNIKNVYLIKIRENVISGGRHEAINAIVWKYKILTNFYSFRSDASGNFLEGLFYDQGRGL
jgi:hypothetical protein